jgi:ketosteroid isomerase-like protein
MNNTPNVTTRTTGEVAEGFYDAFIAGDLVRAADFLADDAVLHVPGTHALAGRHEGTAAILQFALDSRALTVDGEQLELVDLLVGREHAAAYCRITADRIGREPLDNATVHLLEIDDGRITTIWLHNRDDVTVDAFWR